jgi:hypothetical protein
MPPAAAAGSQHWVCARHEFFYTAGLARIYHVLTSGTQLLLTNSQSREAGRLAMDHHRRMWADDLRHQHQSPQLMLITVQS